MEDDISPDFRRNPIRIGHAVELILEDVPGGGMVEKSDFKTASTGMQEGALLGMDDNGIYHLTKTCKVWSGVLSSATGLNIYKQHEFVAGDFIVNTSKTGTAQPILSIIDTGVSYDIFTFSSGFNVAITTGEILIQAAASGVCPDFKFSPIAVAISKEPVNLSNRNNGCGLLVRGRVRENLMPYYVDATIKALLPLVRFV